MITVLSLFDGLGGARIALDRLNIPCAYFASEIDKYAMIGNGFTISVIEHILKYTDLGELK